MAQGPFDAKYAAWRHRTRWEATLVWRVRSRLHPAPGDRLLDIGCGSGHLCVTLGREGLRCVGMDISPTGVRVLADRGGEAVRGDMLALPFADQSFQWVVASHVLEYTSDPSALMDEVVRVLRPGGKVYIHVAAPAGSVAFFLRPLTRYFDRTGGRIAHCDTAGLLAVARNTGLEPLAHGSDGHVIKLVAAVVHRLAALVSRDAADRLLPPLLTLDDRCAQAAGGALDVWGVFQRPKVAEKHYSSSQ